MSTTKTLTVAQLLILTTAAQRPDHMVLPLPPTIRARGGAQRNLLGALLKMDLGAEVPVVDSTIAWRTDEGGQHHGLPKWAGETRARLAPRIREQMCLSGAVRKPHRRKSTEFQGCPRRPMPE